MTILLVEPAATFAEFLKLTLTRLGYRVTHVADLNNIREVIARTSPDLIISEAVLAGMAGLDRWRQLREEMQSRLPLVIVSTDGGAETREAARQAGCVDYLTKPVTSRDIHALMQRHLAFRHQRQALRAPMVLTVLVSDGHRSVAEKIVSMGEGGLYVETANRHPVGTRLDFSIPLPSLKRPVQLRGEVIYVKDAPEGAMPAGMGVKFIGMDANTLTLLEHYMESYLADFLPETPANR